MRGHVGDDHLIDLNLQLIDLRILRLDRIGELVVSLHESTEGEPEIPLGEAAHHQELLPDVVELLFPELAHK
jgi:hypothetical protein